MLDLVRPAAQDHVGLFVRGDRAMLKVLESRHQVVRQRLSGDVGIHGPKAKRDRLKQLAVGQRVGLGSG